MNSETVKYAFLVNPFGFPIRIEQGEIEADYAAFLQRQIPELHKKTITGQVLDFVLERCERPGGLILEFGVFTGTSINKIADACREGTVFGFDSFEGFPEAWGGISKETSKEMFSGPLPRVWDNVTLVKGWFDETLPVFLESHPEQCSLIHIDCDVYSSASTVLSLLRDRIRSGTILVFDEMTNLGVLSDMHEMKAWWEFVRESGIQFEWLCYGYDSGTAFHVVFRRRDGTARWMELARYFGIPPAFKCAAAVRVL